MMVLSVFAGLPGTSYATGDDNGTAAAEQETQAVSDQDKNSDEAGSKSVSSDSSVGAKDASGADVEASEDSATSCTAEGDGSQNNPYMISTSAQMVDLQKQVASGTTFAGKYFKLKNDITIAEDAGFTGIGDSSKKFGGRFDGNSRKITVTIVEQSMGNVGIFGYATDDAVIENLTVAGQIAGAYNAGGIVGYSAGATIRNCVNEAEIMSDSPTSSGTFGAGGIAGVYVDSDKTTQHVVENCVNKGEIKAGYTSDTGISKISFGGIIGAVYGSSRQVAITGCRNEGSISEVPSTAGVGGIAGYINYSEVSLEDCSNSGDISASGTGSNSSNGVGGIAGIYSGNSASDAVNTVARCENTGKISGRDASSNAYTGGITGQINSAVTVEQCVNKGDVTGKTGYAGGIAGYSTGGTIAECYNGGAVSNTKASPTSYYPAAAGGIAGYNYSTSAELYRSYSYGKVSCTAASNVYAGGVIGRPNSSSINSEKIYSNKYLEDSAASGIGQMTTDNEACTSFEQSKANDILGTIGKAFQADLATPINSGYPILRWQNTEATYALDFKVTDKETKSTLRDATVTIEGQTAGEDGSFELAPGTYSYKVTRDGYTDVTGSVTLKKKSVSVDIGMTSVKHKYTVKITPADAIVKIANENNAPAVADPEVTKDEAADEATYVYTLADKAAYGEYSLSLSKYLYTAQTVSLEATGKDDTKTIKMEKAATEPLTIRVKPADARVYLTNTDFDVQAEARSTDNGTWTYDVVPGEYSYKVKAANYSTKSGTLTVPDDKEITVELAEKAVWDGTADTDWYKWHPFTDSYEISEPEELAGLAELVNDGKDFSGKTITLTKDIDLGGNRETKTNSWVSIGNNKMTFNGTFRGNGHKIKNLYIDMTGTAAAADGYRGLFGQTNGADISGITFEGVDLTTSTTNYYHNVGTLVGYARATDVSDITADGEITIPAKSAYTGGLAGKFSGTITDCVNNVDVTSGYQVGGIVGTTYDNNGTKIIRCINNGTITAKTTGTTKTYASGGIAGMLYRADDEIRYCINTGTVTGTNQSLGGILGTGGASYKNTQVNSSYNVGAVKAEATSSYVGGIVGYANISYAPVVAKCYNAGELSGSSYIGGIIGTQSAATVNGSQIYSNYYLANDGYTGSRTTSETITGEAFREFEKSADNDYSELIAGLGAAYGPDVKDGDSYKYNNGYPILRWQDPDSKYQVRFSISYSSKDNITEENPLKIVVENSEGREVTGDGTLYELASGSYTYTVSQKGYDTVSGEFRVNRDSLTEDVKLTAEKYTYVITIDKNVDLTVRKVTDDGKVAIGNPAYEDAAEDGGTGTYTYKLTNSTYEYEAKRLGYEKETGEFKISYEGGNKTIELKASATAKVSFDVRAESGEFAGTDPAVSIYSKGGEFDGSLMGTYDNTSKLAEGLQFPTGDYTYRIKANGYRTVNGSFTVEAGKAVAVSEVLAVKTGWGGAEDIDTDWYMDDKDADTYTLKNESQLAGLAKLVNNQTSDFSGKTILLARDMNLEDNAWTPIGGYAMGVLKTFSGTFDGQGHSIIIKNGEVKASESSFGVFGCISKATVKNLTLQGKAKIDYTEQAARYIISYAGGLAGYAANSTIENCSNQLTLDMSLTNEAGTASVNAGGLTGWSVGTSYESCNNIAPLKVNVTGKGTTLAYAGGIAGFQNCGTSSSKGTITECYNTGDVTASAANSSTTGTSTCYAGGLIGNLSASYLGMTDCYNAGDAKAEGSDAKTGALAAYASGTSSSGSEFFNNYYLDNGLSDPTPDSEKRTDTQMRMIDFVRELGDGYALNNNGGYPILAWEKSVDHIKVSTLPEKTEYNDLSDFDDTGMKLTAYMSSDDSDAAEITSGWTVKNGKKLKATQKSVTIEYKGAEAELPITVNQVTHEILSDELTLDVTAPEAGKTPQQSITLTDEQSEKFTADIQWTKAGKEFTGDFGKASYYRAHVRLTSRYAKDDVYYVFERGAYPDVDSAYEIKNYKQTVNKDNEKTVTEFDLTFKATTNASKDNDDNVSHLYYEGDKGSSADYGSLLDDELTVNIGDRTKKFTVRDIEQKVLEDGAGVQAEYAGKTYAGIKLYDLLLESGLSQNASDDTVIMLTGRTATEKTKLTVGDLRKQDSEEGAIIAYGDADRGTPLGKSKGPLQMIQKDAKAKSRANLTEITIGDAEDAAAYKTTFKVNQEDPEITVKDSYGNEMKADSDNALSYTLRDGESYTYRVTKKDFTVQKGSIKVDGKDQTIEIELDSVWDGKTLTEPAKDDNGYYLIGTGAELMWWHENYKETDKVKLTADIALNNGESRDNNWEVLGTNSGYGSSKTLAFQGIFDGQGHVIRNLSIDRENKYELELSWTGAPLAYSDRVDILGMFGYVTGSAEIRDLGIEGDINVFDRPDQMYADWLQVGGIAGFVQGSAKISGCYTNMGIRAVASLETETVGGYPLGGYGYACDIYIGGIAGSLSGSASITECYTRGTYIGAETRQVSAGGIVGAMRYATNSVTDCYSTASIDARPLSSTQWESYLGGIAGNGAKDKNAAVLKNNFALNKSIKGNDNKTEAGRVAGNAIENTFTGNYGLEDIKITGAKLNSQFDGDKLTAEQAVSAGTYSSWNKDSWKLADGSYPQLAWQTRAAGADRTAGYTGQNTDDDAEWDGYFSEQTPPPYFNLYIQVKSHDKVLARKFTKKDMLAMAASDNQGTLYYSAIGNGYAGRAVKEYVYLDTLFSNAGVAFQSGDSLKFGTYNYDYDGLMADRYYYPEWTSGSDKDAVKIRSVLALKSFGASSGVSKDYWNYYASQADYLYAYMINYGQKTPTDYTYGYFTYQQTEGTVNYKTDSEANKTVKELLAAAISEAQTNADSTYVSEDGSDVSSSYSYTDQDTKDVFEAAIKEAKAVLSKDVITNGDVMDAYDDLAAAQKKFDKAKKQGKGADRSALDSAIAIAENVMYDVTISKDGRNVSEDEVWATQKSVDVLKEAIKAAKAVADDRDAVQAEIDMAETAMKDALSDFITSDGQLEPLARDAAIRELKEYTESLDLDSYREAEKAQIAELLKEYKAEIEDAKSINRITELLTEAKAAIGAVKTEDQAVRSEAKADLAAYKDLSELSREDRAVIREIITEYSDKIDAAKTQEDIDALVKEAKAEIDLTIAKQEAAAELEDWYAKTGLYYEAEQNKLIKIILVNTKAIKDAESITAVKDLLSKAEAAIAKLDTRAVKDNTPSKPAKVKAASASCKSVKITWQKDKKAKGYIVYRAASKKGTYKKVAATSKTYWTNGKLKTGKTYYYKVRAYGKLDGKKLYGGYSAAVKAKPVPAKVKASAKAIGIWRITVSWKKVAGASGYQIYRADKNHSRYKKVATIKSGKTTSFTNKRLYYGVKYSYKVRAYKKVNGKYVYGSFSKVKSATVR